MTKIEIVPRFIVLLKGVYNCSLSPYTIVYASFSFLLEFSCLIFVKFTIKMVI